MVMKMRTLSWCNFFIQGYYEKERLYDSYQSEIAFQ